MHDVIVETNAGKLGGVTENGVHIFKGIPYGASTAGANRFRAPQPLEAWSGIRDATRYGDTSPQRSPSEMAGGEPGDGEGDARLSAFMGFLQGLAGDEPAQGEDCLKLNIWTAGLDTKKSRAVMVWLHGGAFDSGSGSWPMYDGTPLAARDDVVAVTINHRLGPLGFLYLDEIGGEKYAGSGNAGMLDIVQALQWIRDNIASFGGDPSKVMVYGDSGGASKSATLLGMPAAKGLFQRAVIMSGPLVRVRRLETARRVTQEFLEHLNIPAAEFHKLHDVPYPQLLEAAAKLQVAIDTGLAGAASPEDFMPLQPMVDGKTIPVQPLDPVCTPIGADVTTMVGSTQDDMKMIMLSMPWFGRMDDAGLKQFAGATFGELGEAMLAEYKKIYPNATPTDIACQCVTDRVMWAGSIDWAERKIGGGGAPVYMYRFDYTTPALGGILGATHGGEVPFAMNNYTYTPMAGERPENAAMGKLMSETFVRFAHTGNPNHAQLPEWKPYSLQARDTMVFNVDTHVEANPRAQLRALYAKKDGK
ncbi:MAG: putative carboxylesterase, type [Verrucomicrobiaceae bacterium]|nr:putative carboxylesterase, type [Verrucomicrobiaceae bacterium]